MLDAANLVFNPKPIAVAEPLLSGPFVIDFHKRIGLYLAQFRHIAML